MKRPPLRLDPQSRGWTLVAAAACLLPLLLQLPARLGIGIAATALVVAAASWRNAVHAGVRVLLAAILVAVVLSLSHFAVGRDTGCALLAAMLAIKPAETFTLRDARSLLGFALFAPFATFLLDQGPLSLLLGLAGSILALAALLRLTELESGFSHVPLPGWQRFAAVWKLVGIGLPLALAAFWLFPRLATPLWGVPERAMARTGLSDHMSPGDWVDLLSDDSTALRVQFFGATPERSALYWRGPVLWDFDGRTWTQATWLRAYPPASVQTGRVRWDYQLEVEPTDSRQLVALDLATSVPDDTDLSQDHVLYAHRSLDALTRWQMHSSPPVSFEPVLPPMLRRMALALPAGYNPRAVALGRRWRAAGGSDEAIVARAMTMIRRDFAYTLAVPPLGRDSVDEFLFIQKAGYCEHFSSAFVVLMRAAGIPARVVTGYVGGYWNKVGGYWQVRRSDAHAWAEVWLPGRGWVREDPTAAVAPDRIYDTIADRAAPGGLFGAEVPAQVFDVGDWLRHGWNDFALGFDATRQRELLSRLGMDDVDATGLTTLFVLVALLAIAWMAWLVARAERERDPVLRAWHRLDRRYARLGLAREPAETAAAWAERVRLTHPSLAAALFQLSQRFNQWRYAAPNSGRVAMARRAELLRNLRRHRPGAIVQSNGERT
jgi:transglutaminase-like putative cysteine protease